MNAVIYLDVPGWQIGQDVTVYFPDTMVKRGKCELLQEHDDCENCAIAIEDRQPVVRCKDCKHGQYEEWDNGECIDKTVYCDGYGIHKPDWFCGDGDRKEGR